MGITERREREKVRRRQDIIEAARQLFFTKGFHNTTMDDIAKASELARATLYLYFENKEEVYALVLEEGLTVLQGLIVNSYQPETDPLTNLLNGHDAFMSFHDDYPEYYKVMTFQYMEFAGKVSDDIQGRLNGKFADMVTWIARLLAEGIEQNIFRPMPLQGSALLQIGLSMGFAQMIDKVSHCSDIEIDRKNLRQINHDLIANGVLKRERQ